MDDIACDRRKAVRREVNTKVQLFNEDIASYENAHLRDLSSCGMYLITRCKLLMNQSVRILVPCEPDERTIKLNGRVIRIGHHRSWGLFSYGCRLTY